MSQLSVFKRPLFIYLAAIIVSACISIWVDVRETVINPDAICYLFSAEEVGSGGLHAAMHLCPQAMWPFYSVMIFTFAKMTHLDYLNAAFLIDAIFSAISVVAFMAIVSELSSGNRRLLVLAASVILLAHEFNILRQEIIRDHGFWAGYLTSIYLLLRYFHTRAIRYAFAWSVSLIVATAFRIEGAIFFLIMPWLAWFDFSQPLSVRLGHWLKLNTFLLISVSAIVVRLIMHPEDMDKLGRLPDVIHQIYHGVELVMNKYHVTKDAVSHAVLTHVSMRDAGVVVVLMMLAWYLVNVVGNLSIAYAALVLYAWFSRTAKLSTSAKVVIFGYLLINLAITSMFFAENHFLAKRYLVAFSLTMMIWVPFALAKLLDTKQTMQRVFLSVTVIAMMISGLSSVMHFGHSKDYVREAGDWLAANVPMNATLYANDYQLMYYAKHEGKAIFSKFQQFGSVDAIKQGKWKEYDYLALMKGTNQDDETAHLLQEIHLTPLQVFVSRNGSHIYIYKVVHREI